MPDVYRVRFATTKGRFVVEVHKEWAPLGAERFWRLVDVGFFDKSRVFRVKRNFVVQFGVSPDPRTNAVFNNLAIKDDPVKQGNKKGMVSFATNGPGTRRTQVFVNLSDNTSLDKQGFAPFAKVVEGMDTVVDAFYAGYGDMPPLGMGPDPSKLAVEGDSYAESKFPRLDTIFKALVVD
jgi:peptidyl-prolyl cis-trans isomerase A (cyclophilin A)